MEYLDDLVLSLKRGQTLVIFQEIDLTKLK